MIIYPTAKPAVLTAVTIAQAGFGTAASVGAAPPRRDRPNNYVVVKRVGGTKPNPVTDRARIMFELFAPTIETVESMGNTVSAAMHNAIGTSITLTYSTGSTDTSWVRWWGDETGPMDSPDPDVLDRERWLLHGDLWVSTTTPQ